MKHKKALKILRCMIIAVWLYLLGVVIMDLKYRPPEPMEGAGGSVVMPNDDIIVGGFVGEKYK